MKWILSYKKGGFAKYVSSDKLFDKTERDRGIQTEITFHRNDIFINGWGMSEEEAIKNLIEDCETKIQLIEFVKRKAEKEVNK